MTSGNLTDNTRYSGGKGRRGSIAWSLNDGGRILKTTTIEISEKEDVLSDSSARSSAVPRE